jgi:hypothetical protein
MNDEQEALRSDALADLEVVEGMLIELYMLTTDPNVTSAHGYVEDAIEALRSMVPRSEFKARLAARRQARGRE